METCAENIICNIYFGKHLLPLTLLFLNASLSILDASCLLLRDLVDDVRKYELVFRPVSYCLFKACYNMFALLNSSSTCRLHGLWYPA